MTDAELRELAEAAGIATAWRDVHGQDKQVAPDTLRAVLAALGLPADGSEAHAVLARLAESLPPLLTLPCGPDGCAVPGSIPGDRFRLDLEDGGRVEGKLEMGWAGEARLPALERPGYHRLTIDGGHATVVAAPPRCFSLEDAGADPHRGAAPWALAAQIYSLRTPGDGGIGDFAGLAALARDAAKRGAAALAVSPAHALFAADPGKYGPYAPSSRLALNVLHAAPGLVPGLPHSPPADEERGGQADLIDWPAAAKRKLARMRALFEDAADHPDFVAFRSDAGPALEDHARFEALHARMFAADPPRWNWREWPEDLRGPDAPGVARFARDNPLEVAFHAFCQWVADASLGAAQRAARGAGMPIGLVADLAVGTDGGGSHAWSRQAEILSDVSVGAPPDIFSPLGQDWGLTAFSPLAMRAAGFGAFREMLAANLRHAGGLRVDHAMGLQRVWVVPKGAGAADGAYLRYPVDDLLRLLALESHRHRAVVIGEDLGTLPEGFHDRMGHAGVLGMRVLWFEQEKDGSFRPPARWSRDAAAMTTTHDLPTVVGWWRGRDIDWRERLSLFPSAASAEEERRRRGRDREALWSAFRESGAA
ncbi:MAG: 4-alpha-glucanotransferase, partial [Acetobacteraceae bacterium]|nr:4-alpha-glucanotransferase [Acetobacteraceae bacterium]